MLNCTVMRTHFLSMYRGLFGCIEYLRSFALWTAAVSAPPAAVVSSPTKVSSTVTGLAQRHQFTRKDFLNTLRNRLFAIDEQLWLHEYARANPKGKIDPLADEEVAALQDLRQEITRDLPVYHLLEEQAYADEEGNTPEVQRLQQKIDDLRRQLHCPVEHVNQIVVSSASGRVLSLIRGNGAAYQRLLPPPSTKQLPSSSYIRQLQHATFSSDHRYVGVVDLLFRRDQAATAALPSRASALVYQVTTDPHTYGGTESLPYFDSGPLPGAPFFVRFSPDSQHLVFLSTPYPPPKKPHGVAALFSSSSSSSPSSSSSNGRDNDGGGAAEGAAEEEGGSTALMLLEWAKYRVLPPMRNQQRRWVPSTLAGTRTRTLLRGDAIYFTYTTASPANATIVAHVYESRTPSTATAATATAAPVEEAEEAEEEAEEEEDDELSSSLTFSSRFRLLLVVELLLLPVVVVALAGLAAGAAEVAGATSDLTVGTTGGLLPAGADAAVLDLLISAAFFPPYRWTSMAN